MCFFHLPRPLRLAMRAFRPGLSYTGLSGLRMQPHHAIAEGTTGIIKETVSRLNTLGIKLTQGELNKFATNLTMILVNHGHTSLNIFDNGDKKQV